ncbi:MAG: METTL5 family protein [Candidatus Hodarchaeales archaeon]|jgi:putative methylase
MKYSKNQIMDFLKAIPTVEMPSRALEQYSTPQQLAWDMVDFAHSKGDISGRVVWDLGCGTGILAFGAALMGARLVIGVDMDYHSLLVAANVLQSFSEPLSIQFIASSAEFPGFKQQATKDSTVVMNPPFGTQRKGIDMVFLRRGFQLGCVVYSLHKANQPTRRLIRQIADENGFGVDYRKSKSFPIPKMFKNHQREVFPVSVDFYRFVRG